MNSIFNTDRPINTVYATTDYSKFTKLEGNREDIDRRAEHIWKAIQKSGFIVPAIVNEKYEVIDGQARLEMCKRHEIPYPYIIEAQRGIKECMLMNGFQTPLEKSDFVKGNCSLGNENYLKLQKLMNEYEISANVVVYAMGVDNRKAAGINTGDFTMSDEELEKTRGVLDKANEVMQVTPKNIATSAMYKAIIQCIKTKDYDHCRMVDGMKKYGKDLIMSTNAGGCFTNLKYVYNLHRRKTYMEYYKSNSRYRVFFGKRPGDEE